MNKYFNRAFTFAALAALSLTSCSSKSDGSSGSGASAGNVAAQEHSTQTAEVIYSNSYKAEPVDCHGVEGLWDISAGSDGSYYANGSSTLSDDGLRFFRLSADLSAVDDITPDLKKDFSGDEVQGVYAMLPSGDIAALIDCADHHGMTLPGADAPNDGKDFDYDEYERNTTHTFYYALYGTDGTLKSRSDELDLSEYCDERGNFPSYSITAMSDGSLLFCDHSMNVIRLAPDGSASLVLKSDSSELSKYGGFYDNTAMFTDRDGNIMITSTGSYPNNGTATEEILIRRLDTEKQTLSEPLYKTESIYANKLAGRPTPGRGDYLFFVPEDKELIGVKEDGTAETVLRWRDSDIPAFSAMPAGEQDFIGYYFDTNSSSGDRGLVRLVRRKEGEGNDISVITLAGYSESASKFNKSQDKYRIDVIDYSKYNDPDDIYGYGAQEQLRLDIVAGNAPDIIITDDHELIDFYGSKGAFCDLYTFMENDPDVNRETLLPNILEALEDSDGKLWSLTPDFFVHTTAVKKKFGQKENWTLDDMIELYDNAPATADHLYDSIENKDMLRMLISGADDLVDYEKGTCNFDSDEFIKMLRFADRFTDKIQMPDKETDPYGHQAYYTDKFYWWSQDRVLMEKDILIGEGENNYSYARYVEAKDEITLTGFPTTNGTGGKIEGAMYIAILNTCPDKEGAWQFVRSHFLPEYQGTGQTYLDRIDYQNNTSSVRWIPVRIDAFNEYMDWTMHLYGFDPETGETIEVPSREQQGEMMYPLTQEERDDLARYIMSCRSIMGKSFYMTDDSVMDICLEEASRFFAGDATAENTAEMIQNRCSILVSEQS